MMEPLRNPADHTAQESAKSAFLTWEKFRLAYNLLLSIFVIAASACWFGFDGFQDSEFWWYLVYSALLANVCFCVGPWVEGWLSVAGADREPVRWVLFVSGTVLACGLVLCALMAWQNRAID
jgi:hypothetical protein